MIKNFKMFESNSRNEIMGFPSGEYIIVSDDDVLNTLVRDEFLKYNHKYGILTFNDRDYYKIMTYLTSTTKSSDKTNIINFINAFMNGEEKLS